MMLLLLPQMHYEFEYGYSLQVGAGGKWDDSEVVFSAVARLIKTF
jgi:hypothetical protein